MMDSLSLKSSFLLMDFDAPDEDYFSRLNSSLGLTECRGKDFSSSFLAEGLWLILMELMSVFIRSSTWLTLLMVLANCMVLPTSTSLCCGIDCMAGPFEKSWENYGLRADWSLLVAMAYCCWMVLWYLAAKSPSSLW